MANPVEKYCDEQSDKMCDWYATNTPSLFGSLIHLQFISLETFEQVEEQIPTTNSIGIDIFCVSIISALIKNENIPVERILPHCKNILTMKEFCKSSRLTLEFILNNPSVDWSQCWDEITANNSITIEQIDEHNDLPWNWNNAILKPRVTEKIINKYLHKINNFRNVFCNPNISWKFIVQHANEFFNCHLDGHWVGNIIAREKIICVEFHTRAILLAFIMDFYQYEGLPHGFTVIDSVLSNSYIVEQIAKN
jgi:hypothetical protein